MIQNEILFVEDIARLFHNVYGRKCTHGKVREYLKRISKEVIGIEITPHYFRHRFLTECGKANVPIVDVMAISGIKDINVIVKYYSHSTEEGSQKCLKLVGFDDMMKLNLCVEQCGGRGILNINKFESLPLRHCKLNNLTLLAMTKVSSYWIFICHIYHLHVSGGRRILMK